MSSLKLELWRSLDELEGKPGFEEYLHREFPREASVWNELEDAVSRRNFLKLMSASLALAGLNACTKMPAEKIIPYVIPPEKLIPGEKQFYATSYLQNGFAKGLLVESHESRPTKIEGNPDHPASFGATDIFAQAEILSLYDPDRSKTVTHRGEISGWDDFARDVGSRSAAWKENQGQGVVILTETFSSPSFAGLIENFLKLLPKAKWYAYDPLLNPDHAQAIISAFGQDLRPIYHFDKAKFVLSLDADFLGPGPAQQAYARQFMASRRAGGALSMADSSVSLTGAVADHRVPLAPSQIEGITRAIARKIGIGIDAPAWTAKHENWVADAATRLLAHPGQSVVIAGEHQSKSTQIIAHAMNERLRNFSRTVDYIPTVIREAPTEIRDFLKDLSQGKIDSLFILGGNPAYDLPGMDLSRVPFTARLGLYEDETSKLCQWRLPETHFLESWGDARAFDGTLSFQQPLIEPLYEGKSASEFISLLTQASAAFSGGDHAESSPKKILEAYWKSDFSEQAIGRGMIPKSQFKPVDVKLRADWRERLTSTPFASASELEISFRPDPTVGAGRYSNNGWLQELPKPLLQLTWGNAAVFSPASAEKLGFHDEDLVEIKIGARSIEAPVLRVPGHPEGSVTLYLGYGRTRAGSVGSGHGYDAYSLMGQPYTTHASKAETKNTDRKTELALTHAHSSMEGRDLVRTGNAPDAARNPPESLLTRYPSTGEAWSMVIDLNACIGCNACSIACQAENNIPIVGKEQVRRSREMHWIRVDRYFQGSVENPRVYFQPVPCMQCENAPCEEVCPTAATNHSHDGLNQMMYNRCVGTRYCSNNCPYKVRRFNFFQYNRKTTLSTLMHNPDVTVRSRGVMEKCTYCVQRIQEGRITAEKENRKVRDGEIVTACQAVCPTTAIAFGDQNDPESRVARLKRLPSNYSLLNDLGTLPRTTYLSVQVRS